MFEFLSFFGGDYFTAHNGYGLRCRKAELYTIPADFENPHYDNPVANDYCFFFLPR
jgi:hypothetical protein